MSAVGAVFLVTITRLAPDLLFGQVTDVVNDKSSDTAQADLLAFAVFLVGIGGAARRTCSGSAPTSSRRA